MCWTHYLSFSELPPFPRHPCLELSMSVVQPEFLRVLDGLPGAEGPVFDNRGNFYLVAPEVEAEGKAAGQILRVDLTKQPAQVTYLT